jgi:hypothetical protein
LDRFSGFSKINPPTQIIYLVHKAMEQALVASGMDCQEGVADRILPIGLFSEMLPG